MKIILNLQAVKNYSIKMIEIKTAEIPVSEYISGYRDSVRINALCRQCRNYGKVWMCPPFVFDADARLSRWSDALIVACSFHIQPGATLETGMEKLRATRKILEENLLRYENEVGGLAFGFSGECLHCKECTRAQGRECRHPELVRPALEAYGFDVGKTVSELLGIQLQWAPKGKLPEVITLVGAVFYNREYGSAKPDFKLSGLS